ncbi:hypothetical protein RRSWK_00519 [Rhodopirellula sp. SWK7]|nr:hypothetical protein RRSWK_00519 [Rhodopirellula sp. SWK7]
MCFNRCAGVVEVSPCDGVVRKGRDLINATIAVQLILLGRSD